MNALVMPNPIIRPLLAPVPALLLALFLAIPLASCSPPSPPPPLEGAAIGGYFELVDAQGQTVHWEDFSGSYRMVYFGYAWCPDVCPFDLNRMMVGYRQFAEANPDRAAYVQPIFITIDPTRDTPEKIGEYTANFGEQLIGLTGTPEEIDRAARNFAVYYERGPEDDNVGYLMDHSRAAYLMGRDGEPIALLSVDQSAELVASELDQWVR